MDIYNPIDQALFFAQGQTVKDPDNPNISYHVGGRPTASSMPDEPVKSAGARFSEFMSTPAMKGVLIGAAVLTIIIIILVFGLKK